MMQHQRRALAKCWLKCTTRALIALICCKDLAFTPHRRMPHPYRGSRWRVRWLPWVQAVPT